MAFLVRNLSTLGIENLFFYFIKSGHHETTKTLCLMKQTPKCRKKTVSPSVTAIIKHCGEVLVIVIKISV